MRELGHALGRAVRRRCPACGAPVFDGWFHLRPVCGTCGLLTDRGEPDYFLGAVLVNVILAELAVSVLVLAVLLLTWPTPPWRLVFAVGIGAAVAGPLAGYPYSKTLWLAVDMSVRPARWAHDVGQVDA